MVSMFLVGWDKLAPASAGPPLEIMVGRRPEAGLVPPYVTGQFLLSACST